MDYDEAVKRIREVISLMEALGYTYEAEGDYSHNTRRYKKHIKDFSKAKTIMGGSGHNVVDMRPLPFVGDMIHYAYHDIDTADRERLLKEFDRKKINFDVLKVFDDLDHPMF